jgi:probable dihydroxyacetone kinase regulator
MAQTTKKALAASFKKLIMQKSFDKITVIDIVEDCEVTRQTFYYHFKDIFDLVEWIYTSEASKALDGKKTYETWQQGILQIFEYVLKNKAFVVSTYHSISREHLERFLYNETYNLLIDVIEEKAQHMTVRDDDKAFIANFYKCAFVGLMFEWIRTGMKEKPALIVERLNIIIHGDITKALENFRVDRGVYTNQC